MQTANLQTDAVFTQYLNVVNRALGENKSRMPYKQVFAVADKVIEDEPFGVSVYKDDAAKPHEHFEIAWHDGTFNLTSHGKSEAKVAWSVPEAHLREVVSNPEPYVEEPAKLDLDWLSKRIGIS